MRKKVAIGNGGTLLYYDSIAFLCFFLPILLVLEGCVKGTRGKNIFLLAAGLVFYASGSFHALILLLISAVINWGLGLLAMRERKAAVFLAVVLNIGLLAAYRYSDLWLPAVTAAGRARSVPAATASAVNGALPDSGCTMSRSVGPCSVSNRCALRPRVCAV